MHILGKAVVVLHRSLNDGAVLFMLNVDRVFVNGDPILIQATNETGYAALEIVGDLGVWPDQDASWSGPRTEGQ